MTTSYSLIEFQFFITFLFFFYLNLNYIARLNKQTFGLMFSFTAGDAVSDQSLQLHQRPQFVDYGMATASD